MTLNLPGYSVDDRLYSGRRCDVYHGRCDSDGAAVVLKCLQPFHHCAEAVERFRHQFELVRSLDGRGAVNARELITHRDLWVLVEEDIGGESLDRMVGADDLPLDQRLLLALHIVDALDQVHAAHIIHKDINPSNIVWNRDSDRVALIDFGIATRLSREDPVLRNPNVLEGTLAYLAPEQTGRMNASIDYRADYYSLGVTVYELLTGRRPFLADDALELVHCHIARRPPPLEDVSDGRVPAALGAVVMKLLAKSPDERYQSLLGVSADLRHCLEQLKQRGDIPAFPTGRSDRCARLTIPQRLYGRDAPTRQLLDAFAAANAGDGISAPLMLVTGASGIGKSALVRELYTPIAAAGGYFAGGKFDQLQRSLPYSAVVDALRELIRELLGEPEQRLRGWRDALADALGPNGRVIIDVVPELELIIGPQPDVQTLEPKETRNRFNRTLRRFIGVFARPGAPLVLFIDDLQWADRSSLRLIQDLLTENRPAHLLLIAAYRDTEVGPGDPLPATLTALIEAGVPISRITLEPLTRGDITALVADTLALPAAACGELAERVWRNTDGNPLFARELLVALHDDGLIVLDRAHGRWTWDLAKVEQHGVTANVLDLMIGKLQRLPPDTRDALRVAGCIGAAFELRELAAVLERDYGQCLADLLPAVNAGVITSSAEMRDAGPEQGTRNRLLRFFHDGVQRAAYALTAEQDERAALHLRIGRLLLADTPPEQRGERLFDLVDQLNRGRMLMDDQDERIDLASMNLEAGQRARGSTAYSAATQYLDAGIGLLPDDAWQQAYPLTLSLHREMIVASFLGGEHERADEWARITLQHARDVLERAEIERLLAGQQTMAARYPEALESVRRGLALLGVDLPRDDLEQAVHAEFANTREALGDTPVAELLERPDMNDPRVLATTRLLLRGLSAAFYVDHFLYFLIILKAVNNALRHGHPPDSYDLYSYHGHLLSSLFGRRREGYEFARLAVQLSERKSKPQDKCRSCFILANWVTAWVEPLAGARAVNDAGFEAGLDSGELEFAGYTLLYKGLNAAFCGQPIAGLRDEVQQYLDWNQRVRNTVAVDGLQGIALTLANLDGSTADAAGFDLPTLDEATYVAACETNQSTLGLCYFLILKAHALYLYRDFGPAAQASDQAEALLGFIVGNVAVAEHAFTAALLAAALSEQGDDEARQQRRQRLDRFREQLAGWAADCAANFAHMQALADAEAARVDQLPTQAAAAYEQAIAAALENGFPHHAALAGELYARFWLERGQHGAARAYLREAFSRYHQWQARRKCALLQDEFDWLQASDGDDPRHLQSIATTETTSLSPSGTLDLSSVMRASQTISSEIQIKRLLERLMQLVIENAGARRGLLLLDSERGLRLQASASVASADEQPPGVEVLQDQPLADCTEVANSVINYAQRIGDSVIVDAAIDDARFNRDTYVARSGARSILCLPLTHQGQRLGLLYLENGLTDGAFTPDRLELLRLLASQFAISFENARLYNNMEREVEQRTAELAASNRELQATVDDLRRTQRQLVHAEKMASLGQLAAGVAHEINNPLNFVNNFAEVSAELIDEVFEQRDESGAASNDTTADILNDLKANIGVICNHGARAADIVSSMLQHAGGTAGDPRPTHVNDFVRSYVNLAEFSNRKPGLSVTVGTELATDAGSAELIPQELGRVLVNLLNNAFDAIAERHQHHADAPDGRILVSTRRAGRSVEVRVQDNGSGIPVAVRERIFEPFFTTKSAQEGTGLGLSLAWDIVVNGHGGSLEVNSDDQGTCFVIRLPGS